jgi:hypothetical protein
MFAGVHIGASVCIVHMISNVPPSLLGTMPTLAMTRTMRT